ncbi:hypothetical protein AB6819_09570 [Carnobacterium maltaromaticum]|uniref:hypothetical protein n=1 Tax=Carnobacterium maltaromaticum TaxID=2751 RepID=UPI000704C294|nr:hypothetical protein [Carnobacterium maltaromaticum]KRN70634.1 hypothetical protein IV76_GL001692 [Carnobacterium maltaromaticum]CRH17726.1 conserved hypothetical protein [Carnobacterium maltaromaticum]
MSIEKIELPESNTKNRFDELLEKFEISKSEMNKEELQGFAKAVLKYASSNEEANKYIDQLLADILEKEERKSKFKVGEYYFSHFGILKVSNLDAIAAIGDIYSVRTGNWMEGASVRDGSAYFDNARKATDEEIKLFKRAEMYHKHGRKLDELKVGDLLIDKGTSCEIYQVEDHHGAVEDIIAGLVVTEIYLTVEEQEEAYKKIVGE